MGACTLQGGGIQPDSSAIGEACPSLKEEPKQNDSKVAESLGIARMWGHCSNILKDKPEGDESAILGIS